MILNSTTTPQLQAGNTVIQFLSTGDVYHFSSDNIMINQLFGNTIDGSLNNIYLRVYNQGAIQFYPLLGSASHSSFHHSQNKVKWMGTADGIQYEVVFHLASESMWFWEVNLEGNSHKVDLVYGQDVGLADKNALRSNEAYTAQYVDHAVFESKHGHLVCSRQNQPQGDCYPYLQQGALGKITGFSTDGFQFYGLSYKETNLPEALTRDSLANEVYQYEFAYTALQSELIELNGKASFVFYGSIAQNHAEAVRKPYFENGVLEEEWKKTAHQSEHFELAAPQKVQHLSNAPSLSSTALTMDQINEMYPERILEEWEKNTLLSFFTPTFEHIVLKEKELQVERSHGHILMSGGNHRLSAQPVITSTSYMPGVFNAQLVLGNTSMNKLMSNVRNPLNIFKTSGQRIYVKMDAQYHLLTMPAVYETGFNYARWIYQLPNDTLTITSFTAADIKSVTLTVSSSNKKTYDFIVSNQLTMNNHEYDAPFELEVQKQSFKVYAGAGADNANVHPDLAYRCTINKPIMKVINHQLNSMVSIEIDAVDEWTLTMEGSLTGEFKEVQALDFEQEKADYKAYFKEMMNGFSLSHKEQDIEKVNAIAWWYTHNMLVHYSVPHGLEQYGGAAWGTRDVCQGPAEYFLATNQYERVKEIIKTVYSHQYQDKGDWPQWFMFDEYQHIQHDHSHGDVIVWPLKVVADYLSATGDYSVLEMPVPYTNRQNFSFTETELPLLDHINKQIQTIKDNFLHDTHLSSYGDGDWDDTLQPANQQLREYMVSSWTVALTFQTIRTLAESLENVHKTEAAQLMKLASGIESDFKKYMLNTDVIPGFLYFEDPENPENMVHPSDQKTGIQYRLLPMTRSMISELLTPEEAEKYEALIREKFYCPDGVRLMDRPANYDGGVTRHFKRAEQASNFGREIGLQYVHAHIRFVEAMAKLGRTEEVWKGLETINPIGITSVVPNAEKRQSNAYFSSSDGKFNTRYEAQDNFDKLRTGEVPVKGGWRIYSSGPGIYMNQLISNALGIRHQADSLIIDPVLPPSLDGLEFSFNLYGKPLTLRYRLGTGKQNVTINNNEIPFRTPKNRYRESGVLLSKVKVESLLNNEENLIEVWS